MIVTKYTGAGGGGGYVLPTATANRLGGIKVGSGLTVQSDGTLSAEGGASGGGDYIVTEDLSSITNPTEGMIAYVQSHTGSAQCDVYYIDFAGVTSVDDWLSIYIDEQWGQFMYISIDGEGTVNNLELRDKDSNSKNLATTYKDQWIDVDNDNYTNIPEGYKALYFDGSILSIAVLGEHEITNASYGSISGTTGTYSYSVFYEGESFIYTSGNTWVKTEKPVIYLNELDDTDTAALFAALTSSGKSFFDYDIRWYDDSDRAFAVQLTAFRSGINWTGTIWLSGYANHDYNNKFVVVEIQSSGSKSPSIQNVPVINSDAKMRIDDSGNCIDMMNVDSIWADIAYGEYNEFKGLEKYIYYNDDAGNSAKGFIRSVRRDSTNEGSGYDIVYISATIDMPDGNSYAGKWHWNHQDTQQGVTKDSWTQIQ